MKKAIRVIASILIIAMSAAATGLYAWANDSGETADAVAVTESTEAETTNERSAEDGTAEKDETVYVIANSDGSAAKTIVANWLKNPAALDTITDSSILEGIKNVKGDEAFTADGENLTWAAGGADIYYQGTTDKAAPVTLKITYFLDGKEISADELKGKSGKVTIRYDYINNQTFTANIGGKDETLNVPYVMATGMLLDSKKFINVTAENGRVISDGDHIAVVGIALPGLQDSLGINEIKDEDGKVKTDISLPDYFEVTADVTDFELDTTLTCALGNIFQLLDINADSDIFDIDENIKKLTDAADELSDGTGKLYDGITELFEKSGALTDGVSSLKDGAAKLENGSSDLADGLKQINDGAASIAENTGKINDGASALSDGASSLKEGAASLKDGAASLKDGIGQLESGAASLSDGVAQVSGGADSLAAGIAKSVDGTAALADGIDTAAANLKATIDYNKQVLAGLKQLYAANPDDGIKTMVGTLDQTIAGQEQILASMTDGNGGLKDGASALKNGAAQLNDGAAQLTAGIAQVSDGAAGLKDGAAKLDGGADQLQAGIAQAADGAASLAEGGKTLADGAAQLDGGAAQLAKATSDAYNGAASLKDGAAQLSGGIDTLAESVPALIDGVSQLKDGAKTLDDGMNEFNETGISKIADLVNGDLKNVFDRLNAMKDEANVSENFSGVSGDMLSNVKYIYTTAEIK